MRADALPAAAEGLQDRSRSPYWTYLARLDSDESRRTMRGCLGRIAAILMPGTPAGTLPSDAVPWHLLRYEHAVALRGIITARTTSGEWSPSHANKHLAALRGIALESWRLGHITAEDKDRIRDIGNIKAVRVPAGRSIAADEVAAMLTACIESPGPIGLRDAAMIAVLQSTGNRRAEVAGLLIEKYDQAERAAVVVGKGNKERTVHLHEHAVPYVTAWLACLGERRGPFFRPVDRWGHIRPGALTPRAVGRIVDGRRKEAGLPPMSTHDYRRTFIGDMLDKGVDLVTVQQLVGHADPATTARYDRRPGRRRRAAVDLLTLPDPADLAARAAMPGRGRYP